MDPVSRKRQIVADSTLVAATFVWGATFVLIKDVVEQVTPMLFLTVRFAFASVALALLITAARRWSGLSLREVKWGAILGLFLWAGYAFQTVGIQTTTASNAGFITGLSVILVPVFGLFLLHARPDRWSWMGVVMATLGLGMLSLRFENGINFNSGDPLVLGCAVAFAVQIVLISRAAPKADPFRLTFVQILTAGVLNGVCALFFEPPVAHLSPEIWGAAAFMGVVATAMALGAQTVVQRFTTAVHTALIFTLEPVFAAIFGVWLQNDQLTGLALLGAVLILSGMLVAELGPTLLGGRAARGKMSPKVNPSRTDLQA
jgi:drug/metabolite transporter (DMT)-like permease